MRSGARGRDGLCFECIQMSRVENKYRGSRVNSRGEGKVEGLKMLLKVKKIQKINAVRIEILFFFSFLRIKNKL